MDRIIKPGPVQQYHFEQYAIGHEIKMPPLKQSSFKSMLSKFNKNLPREQRHQYAYESLSKVILATRVR